VLEYQRLTKNRRQFLALTGRTPKEFVELHQAFRRAYQSAHPEGKTAQGNVRQRKAGGGRKGQLGTTEQKLRFCLVYQKASPLQVVLGEVFEMSQSRANRWIHELLPMLKQALEDLDVLPTREPGKFARHDRRHQEARELIMDGTTRRRQRPKTQETQGEPYRGKQKPHSDKKVRVVNAKTKRVGYLSQTYAGKSHDKKSVETEAIRYPRAAILYKDPGGQGYEPNVAQTHQPKKSRARERELVGKSGTSGNCLGFGWSMPLPG
jgi:Helix-turn-helix of DDE superfamily endonuclease